LNLAAEATAAGSTPGRLSLVGLAAARPGVASGGEVRRHSALRAVATTTDLEAADAFAAGFGVPRPFCCGTGTVVSDIHLPPGMTGGFAITQTKQTGAAAAAEVYDWAARTWRPVPPETGLAPTEIKDAIVRVRHTAGAANDLRAIAGPT